ncbi:MAG: molybdopterin-dependent oxidoreductase, partial [Gemmatimonadetes bacterium]|nr:molybdopterin-dependent oxidoreductase [Gemmatimonadota bacterium]
MTADTGPLHVVQDDPFNAETPLRVLAEPVTPLESFFVRSNFAVPRIDADEWRLSIGGLVGRPAELSLDDIQSLGETDTT